MNKRWHLTGKKALVTGATKGIGAAIARELQYHGAAVFVVARNSLEVEQFKEETNMEGIAADVSEDTDRERIINILTEKWGKLDIFVNNAGMNIRKPTVDYTFAEIETIINTNQIAAYEMSRSCYPLLRKSGNANIVFVSSVGGLTHLRTGSVYGMTKAALIQLAKNLACEWASEKIRVNAVAPWYIRTPLAETVLKDLDYLKDVLNKTPLKKIGNPEDVAATIAFLCMPAAAYITGQCINIDGGFSVNGF